MSYYTSRRSAKKLARKSKRNFILTLVVVGLLIYTTISWILPNFINMVGSIKEFIKPSKKAVSQIDDTTLAPPILTIPYEATNTARINIAGYAAASYKVKLFIDDEEKQTVDVSNDGSFTFQDVELNLGTNNIFAKTVDDQKQSLPSKQFRIIYDNEKPKLTINQPEDNKSIQGGDKKVTISGTTDAEAMVFINGNQVIVDKDGNFSSEQRLEEGDNNFEIKAQDQAANTTEISRKVTYRP